MLAEPCTDATTYTHACTHAHCLRDHRDDLGQCVGHGARLTLGKGGEKPKGAFLGLPLGHLVADNLRDGGQDDIG